MIWIYFITKTFQKSGLRQSFDKGIIVEIFWVSTFDVVEFFLIEIFELRFDRLRSQAFSGFPPTSAPNSDATDATNGHATKSTQLV